MNYVKIKKCRLRKVEFTLPPITPFQHRKKNVRKKKEEERERKMEEQQKQEASTLTVTGWSFSI